MNEDYLWDRSGEPDPEIQQVEQVLGTLRYQSRPLTLPAQLQIRRQRNYFSRIAIAAGLATMLAAGAIWLLAHRNNTSVDSRTASNLQAVNKVETAPENAAPSANEVPTETGVLDGTLQTKPRRIYVRKSPVGLNRTLRANGTQLTPRDRAEGEAAKEQLLLALRVASEKLSLAQKKAQGGYPGGLIRNQHKIG